MAYEQGLRVRSCTVVRLVSSNNSKGLLYTKYLFRLRLVQLLDVLVQLHIVLVLPNN